MILTDFSKLRSDWHKKFEEAQEMAPFLSQYSKSYDYKFAPVRLHELPKLKANFFGCEVTKSFWKQGACPFCDKMVYTNHINGVERWETMDTVRYTGMANFRSQFDRHQKSCCSKDHPWQLHNKHSGPKKTEENYTVGYHIQKCLSEAADSLEPIPIGLVSELLDGKPHHFRVFVALYFGFAIRHSKFRKPKSMKIVNMNSF